MRLPRSDADTLMRALSGVQDGLREKLGQGEIPAEVKDAPFVQIPLGVTEDRLVGTVDIEASMKVTHFIHSKVPLTLSRGLFAPEAIGAAAASQGLQLPSVSAIMRRPTCLC